MSLPASKAATVSSARSQPSWAAPLGLLPRAWVQQWQLYSQPIRQRWMELAPRERQGIRWALWAIMALLLVTLGIQPAWRTLQQAPAQIDLVEGQLRHMNQLASEARMLRAAPVVSTAKSIEALQAACDRLGAVAKLNLQGQQASVTFNGVTPEALTQWLREIRTVGRVRVTEASLARTGTTYSGSVLVALGGATP